MTDDFLFEYRIKHTLHCCLYILDCLINNFIKTEIHTFLICKLFCHRIRTNIKADDDRIGGCSKGYVRFIDCTNATVDHTYNNFFIGKLGKTLFHCLYRSLYVCLDDKRKLLKIACLDLIKQIIQRKFALCFFKQMFLILCNKGSRKVLGFLVTRECHQNLPCIRNITETKDLNRSGWSCLFYSSSSVIHHCTYFTAACTCCNEISDMKGSLLYKDCRNRSFTFIKLCFDHKTSCCTVRVCFKLQYLC